MRTAMRRKRYIPNLARTFNVYTQRWRIPWSILSASEKRKRYARALRAQANGFRIMYVTCFVDFARRQRQLDQYQPQSLPRTALGRPMPPLFGTRARTQALAIIWATGPITVRELARARRHDSSSTHRMITGLVRAGLVSKATSGRRYVSINRTHPSFRNLTLVLSALAQRSGLRFQRQVQRRLNLPGRTAPRSTPAEDYMFGSPIRSQIILLLGATGTADGQQMARLLAKNYNSILYAAQSLERQRILRSQQVGARRVFVLSDAYPAAIEYRRFVVAVLRTLPRYHALAAAIGAVTRRYR